MDETIGVQVDQSQCYVMTDVQFNVGGHWSWGSLQECTEAFVTKFHEENGQSRVGIVAGIARYWTTLGCLAKLRRWNLRR